MNRTDVRFNSRREKPRKIRPLILCDSPSRANVVDEISVTRSQFQNTRIRRNLRLKIVLDECAPEYLPPRIFRETRFEVLIVQCSLRRQSPGQPKKIPFIIRKPTDIARRVLTFPPLLTPTRG